jgi:malate dehydrogenase (oxaloacetate-decarboxylating)(NADP+)
LAEITLMAASEMRKLGMTPKVALLSHSNFGSSDAPSAAKMRQVLAILQATAPELEVDGERFAVAAAGMGNPHVVIPVSAV